MIKVKLYFICLILLIAYTNPVRAVLTSGNVTIKLSGGTYSSWAAFWDDLGNLTGDITCTVDASAFTEATAPGAVTESLNGYTLHVLPAAFPTTTDATTGARFTCNYSGSIIIMLMVSPGGIIIEGMVFIEGTSAPNGFYFGSTNDPDFICRRNIFKGGSRGVNHGASGINAGAKIYNNIFYDMSFAGIDIVQDIPAALIANNTIVNSSYVNVEAGDEEVTLKNNLSYSVSTNCFNNIEVLTIGNNNASSDGTAANGLWGGGGTNNLINISDPFNNLGADDFTITAEGVIGSAGLDLSGDFTTDFFGVTRTYWTIGAVEYISAPSGFAGKVMGISIPAKVMGVAAPAKVMGVQ